MSVARWRFAMHLLFIISLTPLIRLIIDPFYEFTILPNAFSLIAILVNSCKLALTFAIDPRIEASFTIRIYVDTCSVSLAVDKLTYQLTSIGSSDLTMAMEIAFQELTFVHVAVIVNITTNARP
jgi:hypothetical protein